MPSRDRVDLRQSVTQWTAGIKPTWSIADVRSALRQHADGDFSLSSQLVDAMGEDDELPGALEKRIDATLSSAFELEAVEAPNRQQSQRLVSQYGPQWWDMFPESEVAELLKWRRMLGVGLGVLDWDTGGDKWTARLRVLHPQFLRFDSFRESWVYQAREGELVVTPGNGKWIMLTDGSRGWMRGSVRALAVTWIGKQLTIRDWGRYNERHGLPIIKAYAPAIADEGDAEDYWESLKNFHSEMVAQLPTHLDDNGAKFDLELLEAKDGSWQSFESMLKRADRKFQVHLLGGNLSSEVVDEGSRAAANTHLGVERSKAKADSVSLATELRRQGLFPIIGFNVPGVTSIDVIPWPKWDTEPPEDDKAEAESKEAFGKAIGAVKLGGYKIKNIDELASRYGLELEEMAPPPPPAAAPADGRHLSLVAPPANDGEEIAATRGFAASRLLAIAAAAQTGEEAGQAYADGLVASSEKLAQEALDANLAAIEREVDNATGYDDLKRRLRARYKKMDPSDLVDLVEAVTVLGDLAGRHAVNEDA